MHLINTPLFYLRRLPSIWQELRERGASHIGVLACDPTVLFLRAGKRYDALILKCGTRPITLLMSFYWALDEKWAASAAAEAARLEREYRNVKTVLLANDRREFDILTRTGARCDLVNHACFVDERIFHPPEMVSERPWDAVLDAQLAPFKRHELAAEIQRLALITYRYAPTRNREWERRVSPIIDRAHHFNRDGKRHYRFLSPEEVNRAYAKARCGLCLSAVEGPCKAGMQYLLAGLPVVSTEATGGRWEYLPEGVSWRCGETPRSVAQAVGDAIASGVTPAEVRDLGLAACRPHRERLIERLAEAHRAEGKEFDAGRFWDDIFFNNLVSFQKFDTVASWVKTGEAPKRPKSIQGW
ncbi:MAG: hypothetical protein SNJ52_00335 [Verrucomicrobiia bacterium]